MSKEDWMPGEGQWIQPFRSIKKKTKASDQYYYEGWFGCGYYDPILTESPRNSHHTQNRPVQWFPQSTTTSCAIHDVDYFPSPLDFPSGIFFLKACLELLRGTRIRSELFEISNVSLKV